MGRDAERDVIGADNSEKPTLPADDAWSVKLVEEPDRLLASIEGDLGKAEWEFAFYLMHGRTRSAIRWYSAERCAEFPKPAMTGQFHATGFIRRPGVREGVMKHSQPVMLGGGAPASTGAARDAFVLVKSYYGLGGDLCVLLSAWRYAEANGRRLVVDWSNGFYGESDTGCLFHALFEAPAFETMDRLRGRTLSVFPPYWAGRIELPPVTYVSGVPLTMSKPEDVPSSCAAECVVLTRDSRRVRAAPHEYFELASRLQPVARIFEVVTRQVDALRQARHSIGIHYRHGNGERTVIPPDPQWFLERIRERVAALGLQAHEVSVYVATDCAAALEYFRRSFPLTVDLGKQYRPNGAGPLHNGRDDLTSEDKAALAEEALVDMYVLSRCDSFVGSLGYFSLFVQLLRGCSHGEVYDGSRVFTDAQRPAGWRGLANDDVLGPVMARIGFPVDGLFVEIVGGVRRVHYYDVPMLDFDVTDTVPSADKIRQLREAVAARRLY